MFVFKQIILWCSMSVSPSTQIHADRCEPLQESLLAKNSKALNALIAKWFSKKENYVKLEYEDFYLFIYFLMETSISHFLLLANFWISYTNHREVFLVLQCYSNNTTAFCTPNMIIQIIHVNIGEKTCSWKCSISNVDMYWKK